MKVDGSSILIVDDTPANLRFLSQVLEQRGYRVRIANSGPRALAAAASNPPDLILLDIMMPEMSGYEVCKQLKSQELTREIPIIYISALNSTEDIVSAFALGGVDYITKPFQVEEVLSRVKTHISIRVLQKDLELKNQQLGVEIADRLLAEQKLQEYAADLQTEKQKSDQLLLEIIPRLQESEAKFRSLIEQSSDGVVLIDEQFKIIAWNQAQEVITGIRRADALGVLYWDIQYRLLPPERQAQRSPKYFKNAMKTLAATGQIPQTAGSTELVIQTAAGERKFIFQTSFPIHTENGYRIGAITRDITERKRVEIHNGIIAEVQDILLHPCSLEDIYRLVSEKVRQLIGDGVTATSIMDEKRKTLRMGSYDGVDIPIEKVLQIINFDPWQKEFPLDAMAEEDLSVYHSSKLEILEGGLYALMTRLVPRAACLLVEKLLSIQKIYGMGFVHKGAHLGGLVILARNDITPHVAAIEQIVNLATIAIERKLAEEALTATTRQLAALLDNMQTGILFEDHTRHVALANQAFCDLFGVPVSPSALVGADCAEAAQTSKLLMSDPEGFVQRIATIVDEPRIITNDELSLLDGRIFERDYIPIPMADQYPGHLWQYRDITNRKRAEQALHESQALTNAIVDSTSDLIWSVDAERYILLKFNNSLFTHFLNTRGIRIQVGMRTEDIFETDDFIKCWYGFYQRALEDGPYTIEYLDHSGTKLLQLTFNLLERAGKVFGISVFGKDITERKQAQERILQSEKKFRELFHANKDGIAIFLLKPHGPPDSFVELNDAAPRMLGYTREEMLNMTPPMLEPHTTMAQFLARRAEFESKGVADFETALLHKDGHLVFAEFTAQTILYENKPAIMNIVRDVTERKQREKELQAIANLSAALRTANSRVEMFPVILEQLGSLLQADGILAEMIDPVTHETVVEAAAGVWASLAGYRQPPGTGLNAVISETRKAYHNNRFKDDARIGIPIPLLEDILAGAGMPLIAQDHLIGFLWVGRRNEIAASEVRLLTAVTDIAANAIHRSTLHERTKEDAARLVLAYDTTLEGWARALELRDHETEGHTRRVVQMTVDLARVLGIAPAEFENVRRGALLHDIGKMGIPDSVLLKPGPLDEQEWEVMRRHPEYARQLLEPIDYLRPALDIPYCHHEKWDGSGYPRGLKGIDIPLTARIFAIVDVWDALTSDRPYRKAWSSEEMRAYLLAQKGIYFDPQVVDAFLALLENAN